MSGGIKTVSNAYRATKDKNKYKRRAAKYRAGAGASSLVSNVAGGVSHSANLGFFGDSARKNGTGTQKLGGAMDIASGVTGGAANLLDYLGNRSENKGHKEVAKRAKMKTAMKDAAATSALEKSRASIKRLKSAENLTDEQKEELKKAKEARNTAKAQKFAMAQAAKLHEQRGKESTKGFLGAVGGGFGLLGSLATGLSKIGGAAGGFLGMIGTGLSAIAGITKTIGGGKDFMKGRKEKSALKEKKQDIVEDYLKEKIPRIKQQASEMDIDGDEEETLGTKGKSISDQEARIIALGRLGVEIDTEKEDESSEYKDKAFQKLTEKRARNILKSSGEEKKEMLETLGLDEDARFEDVVSALSAD